VKQTPVQEAPKPTEAKPSTPVQDTPKAAEQPAPKQQQVSTPAPKQEVSTPAAKQEASTPAPKVDSSTPAPKQEAPKPSAEAPKQEAPKPSAEAPKPAGPITDFRQEVKDEEKDKKEEKEDPCRRVPGCMECTPYDPKAPMMGFSARKLQQKDPNWGMDALSALKDAGSMQQSTGQAQKGKHRCAQ
jgi:hypothetical protein